MFCPPAAGVGLCPCCFSPCPLTLRQQRAPVHGTALTEEGSSIEPDGSLAARRLLLKDSIKELVRESEGLAGRERNSAA